jgi:hypothetical protein
LQHLVACIIQVEKSGYYVYSIKATPVVFVCVCVCVCMRVCVCVFNTNTITD